MPAQISVKRMCRIHTPEREIQHQKPPRIRVLYPWFRPPVECAVVLRCVHVDKLDSWVLPFEQCTAETQGLHNLHRHCNKVAFRSPVRIPHSRIRTEDRSRQRLVHHRILLHPAITIRDPIEKPRVEKWKLRMQEPIR